jgi:hypothetical protein
MGISWAWYYTPVGYLSELEASAGEGSRATLSHKQNTNQRLCVCVHAHVCVRSSSGRTLV